MESAALLYVLVPVAVGIFSWLVWRSVVSTIAIRRAMKNPYEEWRPKPD